MRFERMSNTTKEKESEGWQLITLHLDHQLQIGGVVDMYPKRNEVTYCKIKQKL
jgi:hypothetical protein